MTNQAAPTMSRAGPLSLPLLLAAACLMGALLLLLQPATCAQAGAAEERALGELQRVAFELPKMFNFERFKSNFNKRYHSALEELVRLKLFLARAYRAFLTAVKYKHRQSPHYLAINSRADWTHEELEQTHLRVEFEELEGEGAAPLVARNQQPEVASATHEELLAEPADLVAELERIEARSSEPGFAQLAAELRKQRRLVKREARAAGPRADFDLTGEVFERRRSRASGELGARIESNNPHYEQPDVASEMSASELELEPDYKPTYLTSVLYGRTIKTYANLPVKSKYTTNRLTLTSMTTSLVSGFFGWLGGVGGLVGGVVGGSAGGAGDAGEPAAARVEAAPAAGEEMFVDASDEEPDAIWVDHRESRCLMPVQEQGRCGACYIFAVLAALEWAHCVETGGERVKFSEQYLIDCGPKLAGMGGCNGGRITTVALFVQNMGLELARHYPYRARDEQCPYEEGAPLSAMGYLRVELPEMRRIPVAVWEEHLEKAPMVVNISPKGDFHWYGGGVYDGKQCDQHGTHSMLLIGHGRQDGEEYWLIRNSYSADYGEQGHLKLNKNSDCFHPRAGFVLGSISPDGRRVRLHAGRNARVPRPPKEVAAAAAAAAAASDQSGATPEMQRELELASRRAAAQMAGKLGA